MTATYRAVIYRFDSNHIVAYARNDEVLYCTMLFQCIFYFHVNLIVDAKKKKEQKQMEKEMQRLHLLAGTGSFSK